MNPGPDSINLDLVLELVISIYSSFKRSAIYLSAVAPPLLVRILNCSLSNLQNDIIDKFQLNFFLLSLYGRILRNGEAGSNQGLRG